MLGKLVVRTGATVSKVLTEKSGGAIRAVGVEYFTGVSILSFQAILKAGGDENAEVILSAGAIMTPPLLVKSGIGEGDTVVDVPGVGKNLQDHPVVALSFRLDPELAEDPPSLFNLAEEFEDYFLSVEHLRKAEKGECANTKEWASNLGTLGTAGLSSDAFLKSPWAGNDTPDIQLTIFPCYIEPHMVHHVKNQTDDPYLLKSKAMLVTVAPLQPEDRYQVQASRPDTEHSTTIQTESAFRDKALPLACPLFNSLKTKRRISPTWM
jgi:choline dehydrogenase-like flavoprotein